MINQSNRIPQEKGSPKPIFNESSFIACSSNDDFISSNQSEIPIENSYNNNTSSQPQLTSKFDQSTLANPMAIDHEESGVGASSTTSNISQSNNSNQLHSKQRDKNLLSRKTKRKPSKKSKKKRSTNSKQIPTTSVFNTEVNSNTQSNNNDVLAQPYNIERYPEEEYLEDIRKVERNEKHLFMMKHFPMMYKYLSFHKFIKCLNQRREEQHREIYIHSDEMEILHQVIFLNDDEAFNGMKSDCPLLAPLPKNIWSVPDIELDEDVFFKKCKDVWPSNECDFIEEFALEYLMINEYDTTTCLDNLKDFVSFIKGRAIENNFPLITNKGRHVKNYMLRKTKKCIDKK